MLFKDEITGYKDPPSPPDQRANDTGTIIANNSYSIYETFQRVAAETLLTFCKTIIFTRCKLVKSYFS